jgi:isopenicillin-N N-acyltransferase-like protein
VSSGVTIRSVVVEGTPRERGRVYGEAASDLIHAGIERWKASLADELRIEPDAYLERFLAETSFVEPIRRHTPWVLEEIEGIADGAGVSHRTVLAYNLPDEEWWYRQPLAKIGSDQEPRGCSVIGLRNGPSGVPIAAQNMDVPSYYAGTEILLTVRSDDGPEMTALAYAGSTGLCGYNSAGVSICCNTLLTLPHSASGLPVNCVVRGVLAQSTLADARTFVTSATHASGQAYLIGGSRQLLGLECSAAGCREYGEGEERVWHTNHPLVSDETASIESIEILATSDTVARGRFLEERLVGIGDAAGIEVALSDRTVPICRVPEGPRTAITFGSIVMELHAPPVVTLAPGPPDRTPYATVSPAREPVAS